MEKVIVSAEKNHGEDHPQTAIYYSNLALVLKDLGDYEGAKRLLEKAMHSAERNFGESHPTTAVNYSNLANLLLNLGELEDSLELVHKAYNIFKKTLPKDHPNLKNTQDGIVMIEAAIKNKRN